MIGIALLAAVAAFFLTEAGYSLNRLDKNSDGAVSREEIQDLADERG